MQNMSIIIQFYTDFFQLLFCDFCDGAIHPKCCQPPLTHIPKGDFACYNCRDDGTIKLNKKKSSTRTSSTRSNRNKIELNDEKHPKIISRSVSQLIDGMSNFFLPKKDKTSNHKRQQSVQKAMKILRNKTNKLTNKTAIIKKKENGKSRISVTSKTSRIRRKPLELTDESSSK